MKRSRTTRVFVTAYEIDVDAVASAMLRDDWTRRLIAAWITGDARSHAGRRAAPPG